MAPPPDARRDHPLTGQRLDHVEATSRRSGADALPPARGLLGPRRSNRVAQVGK